MIFDSDNNGNLPEIRAQKISIKKFLTPLLLSHILFFVSWLPPNLLSVTEVQ